MKVLFVIPSFSLIGGVALHYAGLRNYWSERVYYCFQGHRNGMPAWLLLLPDYLIFLCRLVIINPDIVVLNPSFRRYMLFRDGLYMLIAKLLRRKVVCFFHGWDEKLASEVTKSPKIFNKVFGLADLTYVLCSDFKRSLMNMRFPGKIELNTTKVDDRLLDGFDLSQRQRPVKTLLWLARIDRNKGIFVAIDAFARLVVMYPDLRFRIVGNGCDESKARDYVQKNKIPNVQFTGPLRGSDLAQQFSEGDIYILPTYFEGMATSVLEAMAFGLPILTAPVGGVKDFFREGEMGFLIKEYNPNDYAVAIERLINNTSLYWQIVQCNYDYAHSHFLASSVAERMEKDFRQLL